MLLQNLRARMNARLSGDREAGFTLIELLVVMLILGILAAIAIPAFFNQRDKANDAQAKSMARTAQTAMETYATDNGGEYDAVTPGILAGIEDTLNLDDESGDPYLSTAAEADGGAGYVVTVTSPETGNTFSIDRDGTTGAVTFPCTQASASDPGGCANTADWSS
jgi:type IV pilus assembly protein PilA